MLIGGEDRDLAVFAFLTLDADAEPDITFVDTAQEGDEVGERLANGGRFKRVELRRWNYANQEWETIETYAP